MSSYGASMAGGTAGAHFVRFLRQEAMSPGAVFGRCCSRFSGRRRVRGRAARGRRSCVGPHLLVGPGGSVRHEHLVVGVPVRHHGLAGTGRVRGCGGCLGQYRAARRAAGELEPDPPVGAVEGGLGDGRVGAVGADRDGGGVGGEPDPLGPDDQQPVVAAAPGSPAPNAHLRSPHR
jgi:hypothetical protein